ncbi:MAG: hypothetical protein FWD52_00330 [Candidatus Bathyarchaeota archaeon]|nr:hypothetical protein [Candidatus Termiticorpusculum sp.]
MPHHHSLKQYTLYLQRRESAKKYALSLLSDLALYDLEEHEQINTLLQPTDFSNALTNQYPNVDADTILPELPPDSLEKGLVLKDRYGRGALQQDDKPNKTLTVDQWREQFRLQLYQTTKRGVTM